MSSQKINQVRMWGSDFDLFCLINGKPVHIATMGSNIPTLLNDKNRISNDIDKVAFMPKRYRYNINLDAIRRFINDEKNYSYLSKTNINNITNIVNNLPSFSEIDNSYPLFVKMFAWSFVDMARRGFYSFAHVGEPDCDKFFLVAWPTNLDKEDFKAFQDRTFLLPGLNLDKPECINVVSFENLYMIQDNQDN